MLTISWSEISSSSILMIGSWAICGLAACIGELLANTRVDPLPRKGEASGESAKL